MPAVPPRVAQISMNTSFRVSPALERGNGARLGVMAIAAGSAAAQDTMKKEPMTKDEMTLQQCKEHMSMAKGDGMKKDDAMMKKEAACEAMMKRDKDEMARKGSGPTDPMKK
jgi:hypothetical protein